jgi:glycerol-3-phosphate O-acyltransferase
MARDEVAKYLSSSQDGADSDARRRLDSYLDELHTTQRYRFYRALQHPLYPILRKVERITEGLDHVRAATARGRVVYVSNHKSHLDYLIEPLVLDDHGIRPPLTAAGINLFGGALGLIHRHVTGAIPIRRNSKDPLYLVTLRAYVAEVLKRRDMLYYAEGGRSYSGELKSPKTGLLQAALWADRAELSVVPVAVAYDLTLEDRIISREATSKRKRPFAHEVAEMVRHAVGYRSRAFVTFGEAIPLAPFDPESRRDLVTLTHRVQHDIGQLHKVLPTALVATVVGRQMSIADLRSGVASLLTSLAAAGANLATTDAAAAVEDGLERLSARAVLVVEGDRVRVRDRVVRRYYARTIEHLLHPKRTTH